MPDQFCVCVDEGRSWTTNSDFGEYDATHVVIGALLSGAETVKIERESDDSSSGSGRLNERMELESTISDGVDL